MVKEKILVTGHNGYIGSQLIPELLNRKYSVVGLDNNLFRSCQFGAINYNVTEIIKDIRDIELMDLECIDTIIHLAGLSNDPLGELDPELTMAINYRATVRLTELAKKAGVKRFVFSSSCSTYGAGSDNLLDEQSVLNPVTAYGKSKVEAEKELIKLSDQNFKITILRNATAFGYSPFIRFDLVVNNLSAWAYTTQKIFLKSLGNVWRPLVHVNDIALAFIDVLEGDQEEHCQILNFGFDEENYVIKEVADVVGKHFIDAHMEVADTAVEDMRNYRVSFTKFRKTYPLHQKNFTLSSGINDLKEHFQKNPFSLSEFEGNKYSRVKHLSSLLDEGEVDSNLRWVNRTTRNYL